MNSLTRPLPHHCLWRCLPSSISGSSSLSVTQEVKQFHRLCQKRNLHVLLYSDNFRHDGFIVASVGSRQQLHTAQKVCVEFKVQTGLQDSFSLLGVDPDCSDQELKAAYLDKAKAFHPDSSADTADPYKFSQVKDAYKAVLEHRKGRALEEEEEKEADIIFDIKHTAPQHRQYLEFEGVGYGTPSQRQRQYQQHRVQRVTENVFQHRIQKLASETEDALVVRDKQQAKKAIISNALHRIVEDLIQESMKKGDFNNLPGQGQPLEHSAHNPFVDVTTHNLNKILVNNGFAPEWIMLQSEIRKEIHQAREILALTHSRLVQPRSAKDTKEWHAAVVKFKHQINEVNFKIHKFNLIVPFLNKQKVVYEAEKEVKKVVDNVQDYLPEDSDIHLVWDVPLPEYSSSQSAGQQAIDWKQVWRDIKNVFRSSQDKQINS